MKKIRVQRKTHELSYYLYLHNWEKWNHIKFVWNLNCELWLETETYFSFATWGNTKCKYNKNVFFYFYKRIWPNDDVFNVSCSKLAKAGALKMRPFSKQLYKVQYCNMSVGQKCAWECCTSESVPDKKCTPSHCQCLQCYL